MGMRGTPERNGTDGACASLRGDRRHGQRHARFESSAESASASLRERATGSPWQARRSAAPGHGFARSPLRLARPALSLVLLLLAALSSPPGTEASVLDSIEVLPATLTLTPTAMHGYRAIGHFSDGTTQDMTAFADWTTSSSRQATVSVEHGSRGRVTAAIPGQVEIRASLTHGTERTRGTALLTVDGGPIIELITRPSSKTLEVGLTKVFTARARWAGGYEDTLKADVVWSSSNPQIARIASQDAEGAVVQALRTGTVTITARHTPTGRTNSDGLATIRAQVVRIAIEPTKTVLGIDMHSQLTVRAHRSDGSSSVITDQVKWSLSQSGSIWLSTAAGNEGAIKARADGEVRISARDETRQLSTSASAGDATVRVAGRLLDLRVTPEPFNVTAGETRNAGVIGVLSSGELTSDLRKAVRWTVLNPAIASVGTTADDLGSVTGLRAGTTTLSALDSWTGVASTAVNNLVVRGAILSVLVEPSELVLARGLIQPLRAYGLRADGSRSNLTAQVEWTSSAPGLVAIDADGNASALANGSARIDAFDPVTALSSAPTGAGAALTVAGELLALRIEPDPLRVSVGARRKASAVGILVGGGETSNLREALVWTVADPTLAQVGDGEGELDLGELEGLTAGWTTLVARDPVSGIESTATQNLYVQGAIEDIDLDVGNDGVLPRGAAIAFKVRATFSDGSTGNITDKCEWSSDHPTIATVDNEAPGKGTVVGLLQGGRTTIRVDCEGARDAAAVEVVGDMTALAVDPAVYQGKAFRSRRFRAYASWVGSIEKTDASATVAWMSTNPNVARLVSEDPGVAEFVGNGTTLIVATAASGHSATARVEVSGGLVELKIVPERTILPGSSGRYFQTIGTLDGGQEINVSQGVEFTSSNDEILRTSTDESQPALVRSGNVEGTAILTARHPGGLEAEAIVEVKGLLRALEMKPTSRVLKVGRSHRIMVIGRYDQGLLRYLTGFLELRSSNPAVVAVTNEVGRAGQLQALAPGVAEIRARDPISGIESTNATVVEVTAAD